MTQTNMPGQLGNYRLIRLLGRGGFADVYLGRHIHLKSYAAVKESTFPISDRLPIRQLEISPKTFATSFASTHMLFLAMRLWICWSHAWPSG